MAWRVDQATFSTTWDSGEGAYRAGGRWNGKGVRAVYCSIDPATAILEVAVHKGFKALDTIPHVLTAMIVTEPSAVHVVDPSSVPNPNWLRPEIPSAGQQTFGDGLPASHKFILIPERGIDAQLEPDLRRRGSGRRLCAEDARAVRARYAPSSVGITLRFSAGMSASDFDVARLISAGAVPALSLAVIEHGALSRVVAVGVRHATTREPVTERTVFEAASLSKPVVAYAVLQLADAGRLRLDEPLARHVPDYIPDDPRVAAITARHVLAHMTGLPNWRSGQRPLRTYFAPGQRFSYSGEGFVFLQRAVERITGKSLDGVAARLVFAPLEMRDSSFVWQGRFEADHAAPHDDALRPGAKFKPVEANAAYSLQTTAADYARFLEAVLAGTRLDAATAPLWLAPQVNPPQGHYESLGAEAAGSRPGGRLGSRLGPRTRTRHLLPLGLEHGRECVRDRLARAQDCTGPVRERRQRHGARAGNRGGDLPGPPPLARVARLRFGRLTTAPGLGSFMWR